MVVAMMQIRVMRVAVDLVYMRMGVWLLAVPREVVRMLVMHVVVVAVVMHQGFVAVLVLVTCAFPTPTPAQGGRIVRIRGLVFRDHGHRRAPHRQDRGLAAAGSGGRCRR